VNHQPIRGNEAVSSRPLVAANIISNGLIPRMTLFTSKPFISFENIFLWIALYVAEQKDKSPEFGVFGVRPGYGMNSTGN
jgi:hypothetical protein